MISVIGLYPVCMAAQGGFIFGKNQFGRDIHGAPQLVFCR